LFVSDAADADDELHNSQACDRVMRTIDADADVDETALCDNRNNSSLSWVSHLVCYGLLHFSNAEVKLLELD